MKLVLRSALGLSIAAASVLAGCGGRQEQSVVNAAGAGGVGAQSSAGGASGNAGLSGSAGAPGMGGSVELETWTLGPTGRPREPAAAFLDETLAVAALAGTYQLRIVLNLERDTGVEQLELEVAGNMRGPAIAPFSNGFVVAWWRADLPSASLGNVHLQHVGSGHVLGPLLSVAKEVPPMRCSIGDLGESAAVFCGSSILSICTAESCAARVLPDCEDAGDGRLLWDGARLTLARVCRAEDGLAALRVSRLLPSGEPELPELELARENLFSDRPGLALDGDRTLIAFAGWLHTVDAEGVRLSDPIPLNIDEAGSRAYAHQLSFENDLTLVNGKVAASSCFVDALALENGRAKSRLVLLNSELAIERELLPGTATCPAVSLASSRPGRLAIAREVPGAAVAIQGIDAGSTTLSAPRFFDGSMSPSEVLDVFCNEERCRWAVGHRGLDLDGSILPGEVAELSMKIPSDGAPVPLRTSLCPVSGCTAFFTADGATVLSDQQQLRWVNPDGSLGWTEPVPPGDHSRPKGRASPYLVIGSEVSSLWRLHPHEVEQAELPGTLNSAVMCDAGVYQVGFSSSTSVMTFTPLLPTQARPTLSMKGDGSNQGHCVADQIGMMLQFGLVPTFQRMTLAGQRLPDMPLTGTPLASGGEGPHGIWVTGSGRDPSEPRGRFEILRIAENGPVDSRILDLPEAGIVSGVWTNGGFIHVAWGSERAIHLSRFRWE